MPEMHIPNGEMSPEIREVVERSLRDIIVSYGRKGHSELIGEIQRQNSPDLEDLLARMKDIRPKPCEFEHHKIGSIVTVMNCTRRETNAVCGHMGLQGEERGYASDNGITKRNAVATMEEAMGLLEMIGVSCQEERDQLISISQSLRKYDLGSISGDSLEAQQYYGMQIMPVHGRIMQKLMSAIRSIADGTLPQRPDADSLKKRRINWMFSEFAN